MNIGIIGSGGREHSLCYKLKKSNLSNRIVSLFGKNYKEQLIKCDEKFDDVSISGFIGKPKNSKKTRGEQFLFVNNRYIKSSYLNHSIIKSYGGLIEEKRFPFYILFIDINPKSIDINVHPTKNEIKQPCEISRNTCFVLTTNNQSIMNIFVLAKFYHRNTSRLNYIYIYIYM